ncbi:MAG TPA: aromatic aminobenezylarsenical efflux permease ArsG family transporter [Flavisolibacter sp.]|jgi:cytochrome c biogenesis protein CcdA|nr:aromatic aminobenezylarsenical efflux permease ArsG family transporter [Flavisolibacter sp.]
MEWLNELAQNSEVPLLAAFALGLLTSISPCPLATNITATAYVAKAVTSKQKVLVTGTLYTLGRMLSYTSLAALIYYGASKFHVAKIFETNGEKFIGPVMIVIGLIMLDVVKPGVLSKGNLTGKLSEKFRNRGMLGAFLLGAVFALAFCPYSGALFFVILLPMVMSSSEGLALPVIFSIGTGLPVILFSFIIAFSIHKIGMYYKAAQNIERVMRKVAGVVFLMAGLYYLNIWLKLI